MTERPDHSEWMSPQEAWTALGISPRTLDRWQARGIITPAPTPSGYRRKFRRSDVESLLDTPAA